MSRRAMKKQNKGKFAVISVLAAITVIIVIVALSANSKPSSKNNIAVVKDSDLVIRKSDITDKAKFYPVEIQGTRLEVIAVKATDGSIRTAFNTCQICFSSGRGYYKQEGRYLVCQNCGNRFGVDDVEVTRGGCNPVPISQQDKTITDDSIVISKEFLAESKDIFDYWKK